jgi:hypothetical protein
MSMAYDVVMLDQDTFSIWMLALFVGPIALGLVYLALCAAVFGLRRIGQLRRPVDLDNPEIIISRRPKHRLGWTIHNWIFILLTPVFFLQSVNFDHLTWGAIASIAFALLFLLGLIRNVWGIWRRPAKSYASIVLDAEGFADKSTDRPRIPWHDIAAIDASSGTITLTGETGQRLEAATPDHRLLRRWNRQSQPEVELRSDNLEPDAPYARALVRAYWLRRTAGHAVNPMAAAESAVQRA